MTLENINETNLVNLARLYIEMFPENDFSEEYKNFNSILSSDSEICFLTKLETEYVAFIHLALRNDYVEGSETRPTAYIEAVYVRESFRRKGIAKALIKKAEEWALEKKSFILASDSEINNSKSIQFHIGSGFEEVNRIVCFVKKLGK